MIIQSSKEAKEMTRAFSIEIKQKMVERLTGKNSISAAQLARETGITQQNLSRWLEEARSTPFTCSSHRAWTVEQKARIVAHASELGGDLLATYLDGEGVKTACLKRWRLALDEAGEESVGMTRRIRALERELARKERALAEAATLLVLGETLESRFQEWDEEGTEGQPSTVV
jgi:transposase